MPEIPKPWLGGVHRAPRQQPGCVPAPRSLCGLRWVSPLGAGVCHHCAIDPGCQPTSQRHQPFTAIHCLPACTTSNPVASLLPHPTPLAPPTPSSPNHPQSSFIPSTTTQGKASHTASSSPPPPPPFVHHPSHPLWSRTSSPCSSPGRVTTTTTTRPRATPLQLSPILPPSSPL